MFTKSCQKMVGLATAFTKVTWTTHNITQAGLDVQGDFVLLILINKWGCLK